MRKKQRATAEDSLMGARFRELRNRLRPDLASAHELGDALRVTAQTVRNWERGQHIPVRQQRAVRRLLGCDPADLWEPPGYPTLREKIEEMFREMKGRRANLREAVEQSWKELQEIDAKRHKAIVAKLMSMISVAAVAPNAVETVQELIRELEIDGDKEDADFMRDIAKAIMLLPGKDNGDNGGGNGAQGAPVQKRRAISRIE